MRVFLRAGIVLGLAVAAACGKDAPSPVDFNDPAAVSANLSSVDSAFDSDVFRSFTAATLSLDAAAQPAIRPATTLLEVLQPKLERTGAQMFLPNVRQARKLEALIPNLSVAATQGRIIPDSMYGRIFEWNETTDQYEYQGNTVGNLTGVRFVLYALGLDGTIFEPVTAIGTLDIIDLSTPSLLRLQVLVENTAGTTTYVDYNAALQVNQTAPSLNADVTGSISNGLGGGANKTLTFDQSFAVNGGGVRVSATFVLNNPAITLTLVESITFINQNIIINADFRLIQGGETIRTVGRFTFNTQDQSTEVTVTVYVDGHPVASISGDPTNPATQWVDAGGEPLTLQDLAALDDLFAAWGNFQLAVEGLFVPIGTFSGL